MSPSTGKEFILAPSQRGGRAADSWKFWYHGDEFYAASRSALTGTQTKLSFHRNGNWQVLIGRAVQKLARPRPTSGNWLVALTVHWLLWEGALKPLVADKQSAQLIEVPDGHQLAVHLLVAVDGSVPVGDLPEDLGTELWRGRLRGGRALAIQAQTAPLTPQDIEETKRIKGLGNFVTCVPLGPEIYA